jgi:hypothetical protein
VKRYGRLEDRRIMMAINMMCVNSDCKYYWEDCCTRNMGEERIEINADGKCITFEKGVSNWYELAEPGGVL